MTFSLIFLILRVSKRETVNSKGLTIFFLALERLARVNDFETRVQVFKSSKRDNGGLGVKRYPKLSDVIHG